MKRIHITGRMIITFRQHLDVPDDEVEELLSSEDNITCNVDLNLASWEMVGVDDITTRVTDEAGQYNIGG